MTRWLDFKSSLNSQSPWPSFAAPVRRRRLWATPFVGDRLLTSVQTRESNSWPSWPCSLFSSAQPFFDLGAKTAVNLPAPNHNRHHGNTGCQVFKGSIQNQISLMFGKKLTFSKGIIVFCKLTGHIFMSNVSHQFILSYLVKATKYKKISCPLCLLFSTENIFLY